MDRTTSILFVVVFLAGSLLVGRAGTAEPVRERPIPSELLENERNTILVFRRASSSVVFVRNNELRRDFFSMNVVEIPRGTGSGFLWDRKGHVVTNLHVIRGGNSFSVTLADGSTYAAEVVGIAPRKDLAVLKIDAPKNLLRPLEMADSRRLVVGQKVLAIGNPFGLDLSLTTGVISALGREIPSQGQTMIEDVIQIDASINPGNSGGPLLDSSGRLIGVNTAIFSPTGASVGVGFAVPVSTIKRVVPQLIQYGKVRRAGLGVTVLPDHLAERWGLRGVILRSVAPRSPAAGAGMRSLELDSRGNVRSLDLITGIDDSEVTSFSDLASALDKHDPGDRVSVRFRRDGKEIQVRLRLTEID